MSNGDQRDPHHRSNVETMPYRRATPSSPMAALSPHQGPTELELDDEQRDALVKKVVGRVERIDHEVGVLIEATKRDSKALRALRDTQKVIASDVKAVRQRTETMMTVLGDLIAKLDDVNERLDALADRLPMT